MFKEMDTVFVNFTKSDGDRGGLGGRCLWVALGRLSLSFC